MSACGACTKQPHQYMTLLTFKAVSVRCMHHSLTPSQFYSAPVFQIVSGSQRVLFKALRVTVCTSRTQSRFILHKVCLVVNMLYTNTPFLPECILPTCIVSSYLYRSLKGITYVNEVMGIIGKVISYLSTTVHAV